MRGLNSIWLSSLMKVSLDHMVFMKSSQLQQAQKLEPLILQLTSKYVPSSQAKIQEVQEYYISQTETLDERLADVLQLLTSYLIIMNGSEDDYQGD
jgi:hypothetical protein